MAKRFKVGDIVQLKSGGPKMTVSGYSDFSMRGEDKVACTWFAGSKLSHGYFDEDSIEPAKDEKAKKA